MPQRGSFHLPSKETLMIQISCPVTCLARIIWISITTLPNVAKTNQVQTSALEALTCKRSAKVILIVPTIVKWVTLVSLRMIPIISIHHQTNLNKTLIWLLEIARMDKVTNWVMNIPKMLRLTVKDLIKWSTCWVNKLIWKNIIKNPLKRQEHWIRSKR